MSEWMDDIFTPMMEKARNDKGFHKWLKAEGWTWDEYEEFIYQEEGCGYRIFENYDEYKASNE
jgi:hypothetical protein